MTDEMRAELRAGIDAVVRAASSDVDRVHATNSPIRSPQDNIIGQVVAVRVHTRTIDGTKVPPLTTAQQLALSVLLGDDIPLGVLLSACEDAGVFADGLAGEIAEKARAEERERIAAVCDGCAEACQLGVLSGSDDSRTRQNVYRNIAATARKLT